MEFQGKASFVLGCATVALVQSAAAQEGPIFIGGQTVVTGARVEQRLSDSLRSVVVITASDIEESGQLTLAEVLKQFGDVEMASNGGQGHASSVFIRGANSAHTLVLVDGVRLQSATLGTTAFENIPLAQIERIEIVKGPASSLYGSDAIGGVIQVFTRSGRSTPAVDVTVGMGSYNTHLAKGAASTSFGNTSFSLAAGFIETDNFNVTKPTVSFGRFNPDDDGYRNSNVSAKLAHRFDSRNELGASAFYSDGTAHFDNGPRTDDFTLQKLSTYSVYSRNDLNDAWRSLVRVSTSRDDSTTFGGTPPSRFRTDQPQMTWQNTFKLPVGALVAGAEYLRQKVDSTTQYVVTERTIKSLFAGYSADLGPHGVQASVRRDDNSQFGDRNTGSFAYGYRLSTHARVRAGYGTAFHAPSFNDLYFPGFGNPGLQPERAHNREIGFDWQQARQRFSATYFDNRIADLIVFAFNPVTSALRPENVSRARIRGGEFSYQLRYLDTDVRTMLTLQDPKAEPTGLRLQRRAKRHGSVIASRAFGAWKIGAEMVASGERFDSSNEAPTSRMAGYAVFNLSVIYRLSPSWSVDARWNNIGNRKYELVRNFNTPGSNALVSLRWTPLR